MSNDLNLCQFIGRLGRDPEVRAMPNGTPTASISIACGRQWKDKNTGERKDAVEWVSVTFHGGLADIVSRYLVKGSRIYVSGRMNTRKWKDKEGNDRYTTEIVASEMQMLDSKDDGQNPQRQPQARVTQAPPQPFDDFENDSIPF